MLRITIPPGDYFDERTQEFIHVDGGTILLEHSLVSIAKWESKWKKPFLSKEKKTRAEMLDYVRCMTLNASEVSKSIYELLAQSHIRMIERYIEDPMTATTFSKDAEKYSKGKSRDIITAEVIYYWLVALQIPFECQYWHLNRLLTLVRVCNIKNQPSKKKKTKDVLSENARLNAERKRRLGTTG